MTWSDLVDNRAAVFDPLYDDLPALTGVRLRSVHLDGWAPTVTLRLDLPGFADRWEGQPADTVQCHLQFSHVEDLEMDGWQPPATVDFGFEELPGHRLAVRAAGAGVLLRFTANASVLAGHLSAFTRAADGGDGGPHQFVRRLDARLHRTVPPTTAKTFYEHL
ncbi:Imm50 family immunity protein [Streptomyces sp. NPDC093225]|uniref:Imm50 family immunity protein n=1 Tax=Streptomyces sp. NPDC093225 TaxID=3366034 RepID=UPI0037F362C6